MGLGLEPKSPRRGVQCPFDHSAVAAGVCVCVWDTGHGTGGVCALFPSSVTPQALTANFIIS